MTTTSTSDRKMTSELSVCVSQRGTTQEIRCQRQMSDITTPPECNGKRTCESKKLDMCALTVSTQAVRTGTAGFSTKYTSGTNERTSQVASRGSYQSQDLSTRGCRWRRHAMHNVADIAGGGYERVSVNAR